MNAHFVLFIVLAALAAVAPAQAAALSFDFRTGSATSSTSSGSGLSNNMTFTNGGVTVTVKAWGLTGNGSTTLSAGELGRYSLGLGDCNANEGAGCGSPNHQVDNQVSLDFVLFSFSAPVNSLSFTITPAGNYDTDATYYTRTLSTGFNLSGTTLAGLSALGFNGAVNSDTSTPNVARSFNITGTGITSLLLGARVNNQDAVDYFKITSASAVTGGANGSTPEPATMGLLGLSLLGLGLAGRIKRSAKV